MFGIRVGMVVITEEGAVVDNSVLCCQAWDQVDSLWWSEVVACDDETEEVTFIDRLGVSLDGDALMNDDALLDEDALVDGDALVGGSGSVVRVGEEPVDA